MQDKDMNRPFTKKEWLTRNRNGMSKDLCILFYFIFLDLCILNFDIHYQTDLTKRLFTFPPTMYERIYFPINP